jgi:hypothetical protein
VNAHASTLRPIVPPMAPRAADWLARAEREAQAHQARLALWRATGIEDEDMLEGLRRLGVTPGSLAALDLVPAILVGWADGTMSRLERDRLRAQAVVRGVNEAHAAWPLLLHWMLQRPSREDERVLLDGVRVRLDRLPVRVRLKKQKAILRDCDGVARAAGRMLGGPKVSREERETLELVGAHLGAGPSHPGSRPTA